MTECRGLRFWVTLYLKAATAKAVFLQQKKNRFDVVTLRVDDAVFEV